MLIINWKKTESHRVTVYLEYNWILELSVVVKTYILIVLLIETLGDDIKIFSAAEINYQC